MPKGSNSKKGTPAGKGNRKSVAPARAGRASSPRGKAPAKPRLRREDLPVELRRFDPSNGSATGGRGQSRKPGQGKGNSYKRDKRTGMETIAGKHAVIEALESGVPIKEVLIATNSSETEAIDKVIELAKSREVDIEYVPRQRLDERSGGIPHQGVLAVGKPYNYSTVSEILRASAVEDNALVFILDHITDVGNFGAIVRSAEVLGATGIVIPNKRSVDVVTSVYKTSAGAVSRMRIAKVSNLPNACEVFKENGFWVAGASEKAEKDCWESPLHGHIALVMGNEGTGISRLVQQSCDYLVKLPQRGDIGSLNVSCAAVALGYEWMRQSLAKAADAQPGLDS